MSHLLLNRDANHSREYLAGLSWGHLEDQKARHCLNTALWRLQGVLGAHRWVAPKGDPVDEQVYMFVFKVWREEREIPNADLLWRGSIEDALSGEHSYFSTMAELYDHLCQQSGMIMPLLPSRTRRVLRRHRR